MPNTINNTIAELQDLSSRVESGFAKFRGVRKEEDDAKRQLLERVVEIVRPALPALAIGLRVSHVRRYNPERTEFSELNALGQAGGVDLRGVHVAGDTAPRQDLPKASSGALLGSALYLLEDGRLTECSYGGRWSKTAEVAAEWEAKFSIIDAGQAMAAWRLEDVLHKLHEALARHDREKASQASQGRTARIHAVLTLLSS